MDKLSTRINKNNTKTNPVIMSPPVNHHYVMYSDMSKQFVTSATTNTGTSITDSPVEVILYEIIDKTASGVIIESMYPVRYQTARGNLWKNEIFTHKKKYASGLSSERIEKLFGTKTTIQDLKKFFKHFEVDDSWDVNNLATIAKNLGLKNFEQSTDIHETYKNFSKLLSEKYPFYFAVVEGAHRLNLASRLLNKEAVSEAYQERYCEEFKDCCHQLDVKKSAMIKQIVVKIKLPIDGFPSLKECRNVSAKVRRSQNLGFKANIGSTFMRCVENAKFIIRSNKHETKYSVYDTNKTDWFRREYKIGEEYDKSKDYNELNLLTMQGDSYIKRCSILMPSMYDILMEYDVLAMEQKRYNKKKNLSAKQNRREIFSKVQKYLPFISENEMLKKGGGKKCGELPSTVRLLLEFVRLQVISSETLDTFFRFSIKDRDHSKLCQQFEKNQVTKCDFYSIEFIKCVLLAAMDVSKKCVNHISIAAKHNSSRNNVKIAKLNAMFSTAWIQYILEDIMILGENPKFNTGAIKEKMDPITFEYFQKDEQPFIMTMLNLYRTHHIRKLLATQQREEQSTFTAKIMEAVSKNKASKGQYMLDTKDLLLRDYKIPDGFIATKAGYNGLTNDVIPGSFKNFCFFFISHDVSPYENWIFDVDYKKELKTSKTTNAHLENIDDVDLFRDLNSRIQKGLSSNEDESEEENEISWYEYVINSLEQIGTHVPEYVGLQEETNKLLCILDKNVKQKNR